MDQNLANQDQVKPEELPDIQLDNVMNGLNNHNQAPSTNFQEQPNQNLAIQQNYEQHELPEQQNGVAPKNMGPQDNGEFSVKPTFLKMEESHDVNGGVQAQRNMKMQSPQNLAGYQQHQHAEAPHMMQHQTQGYGHQGNNQAYGYQQPKIMSNSMPQQHVQQIPSQHAVMQQQQRPPPMQQQQHPGYTQHQMQPQYQQQYPQQQYPGHSGTHLTAPPPGQHPYSGYGQQHQRSTSPQNMGGSAPHASSYYNNQYLPYIKYQQQQLELNQQKKQMQSSPSKEANTNILDKAKLKEMCGELCGNRDVLDDKVTNVLAAMVDQMVENLVDYSCMYANHRDSDTLEKEDVQFAVNRLFPEISRDHKVRDVQLAIDQQVNANHPNVNQVSSAANFQNQAVGATGVNAPETGGTSIGVGGHISTANYKGQLLRVRREQDQRSMITNLLKNSKQNPNNAEQHDQRRGGGNQAGGGSTHQNYGEQNTHKQ